MPLTSLPVDVEGQLSALNASNVEVLLARNVEELFQSSGNTATLGIETPNTNSVRISLSSLDCAREGTGSHSRREQPTDAFPRDT